MDAAIHRGASPKVEYIVHKHAGNTHTTKQAWTWIPGDGFLAPGPPFSKGQYQGQYQKLDEHTAGSAKASNHGHRLSGDTPTGTFCHSHKQTQASRPSWADSLRRPRAEQGGQMLWQALREPQLAEMNVVNDGQML